MSPRRVPISTNLRPCTSSESCSVICMGARVLNVSRVLNPGIAAHRGPASPACGASEAAICTV
eukprot:5463772-Prymnesium_polylepis.1